MLKMSSENRVTYLQRRKSAVVAYIFLIFLWFFSVHNFYIGKTQEGAIKLMLAFCAILFGNLDVKALNVLSGLLVVVILIWTIIDLFKLKREVDVINSKLEYSLAEKKPVKKV